MAPNRKNKALQILFIVFVLILALGFLVKQYLVNNGIDVNLVMMGNLLLFILSLFTMSNSLKSVSNTNPYVLVRSVYTGFIVRLFVCAAAVFLYVYLNDGKVNKPALFICMGIYMIYSFIEVSALRKELRMNKNA